jgi:hypothetical protein
MGKNSIHQASKSKNVPLIYRCAVITYALRRLSGSPAQCKSLYLVG